MCDLNSPGVLMWTSKTHRGDRVNAKWQEWCGWWCNRWHTSGGIRKTKGVQNLGARRTFRAMTSPNHSPALTTMNKIRWVIKSNKAIVISNLAHWKKIHGQLRYKWDVRYKKLVLQRAPDERNNKMCHQQSNRSTISDWLANNPVIRFTWKEAPEPRTQASWRHQ